LFTPYSSGLMNRPMKKLPDGEHPFSIELTSNTHLSRIEVSDGQKGQVFIEGKLGGDCSVELIEGIMLQISGENGVFRIDITEGELTGVLRPFVQR
jgi:hypothetical protein